MINSQLLFGVDFPIQKIAILRANVLGDFIFVLPALTALRSTYPEAEIVLLGRTWHQEWLADRPSPVDRVVVVPVGLLGEAGQTADPIAERHFYQQMQQEEFDLAIQMHGGGRNSNPVTLQLGAKQTLGLRTPDALPLDAWVPYLYYQSEVLRFLEVVSLVGAKTSDLEPKVTVTARDLTESRQVVPEQDQPLVVLHPGASDRRRQWPCEKFAAVGDALAQAGSAVVVTGTASEQELVQAVRDRMEQPSQDLCARLSLNGLTGLLSRATVVIANDTGPLHLARAVGTPTVGIYWCGNLINAGPTVRTWHRPILSWRLMCPVCGADCTGPNRCHHAVSFVADVESQEVFQAAMDLIHLRQSCIPSPNHSYRNSNPLERKENSYEFPGCQNRVCQ
jgi:ADP-heptose:LPS heptosyltransferase